MTQNLNSSKICNSSNYLRAGGKLTLGERTTSSLDTARDLN